MVNITVGVCQLENWNHDISINHKNLEQQLLLQDPYDSAWLKAIAILSYFIDLVASAIMRAFINYEKGHHGNFRTVINQLLSNLYAMVSYKSTLKKNVKNVSKCHYLTCWLILQFLIQSAQDFLEGI